LNGYFFEWRFKRVVFEFRIKKVLAFYLPEDLSPVYLTLSKIEGEKVTLKSEAKDKAIEVEENILVTFKSVGIKYILKKKHGFLHSLY